ncbi:hypothetical protein, partial [Mailhella sp.]
PEDTESGRKVKKNDIFEKKNAKEFHYSTFLSFHHAYTDLPRLILKASRTFYSLKVPRSLLDSQLHFS